MCNAFSGIIVRSKKVYWKTGVDAHNELISIFKLKDDKIGNLCPFEISPINSDYLNPDKWVFKFDDEIPGWWKKSHESACWSAFKKWKKDVYSKIKLKEARNPINPFKDVRMVRKVSEEQIRLLAEWDSVGGSVWDSMGNSVWDSVRDSMGDSVRNSVWSSVGGSVWDSMGNSMWDCVYAYIGSLFKFKREEWKDTDKITVKGNYPFVSVVKLWKNGLVPSFDGVFWRLYSGPKAKVVFKISKKNLMKV